MSGVYTNSKAVASSESNLRVRAGNADPLTTATQHVKQLFQDAEFRNNYDMYTDDDTGITHVYFTQTLNGLDIENAQVNVNVKKDGNVLSSGSSFMPGKISAPAPVKRQQLLDPLEALKGTVSALQLPLKVDSAEAVPETSLVGGQSFVIIGTEGAVSEPRANLAYFQTPEGLKLVWKIETDLGENWLISYANAQEKGDIISVVDYVADAVYQVYKFGINDPDDGERTLEIDPANKDTSPNGWHNTTVATYTVTRGNNGIAHENWDAGIDYLNNYRPDGGYNLTFNYPYERNASDPHTYIDSAVTQLFYTANIYHDFLEVLGFTEQAGNFEEVNTGVGGLGNDGVILNAQDGSGLNNANFATPADGTRPRMRMYLWNKASGVERDGDLDVGVILHEYTHGLSNRLTGGPSVSTCLSTYEAGGMGEGWSDFFPTAIRLKPNDTRETDYGVATFAYGSGIRKYPYSTSLTTNPTLYSTINLSGWNNLVHAIGSVWAEILYEILWNLEDKYGYQAEVFPEYRSGTSIPSKGRQLAMKLVLEGMKLQPCNPTFLTARDAILDADLIVTEGENWCELWRGFAKRGLGVNASQGNGTNERVDGFNIPDDVCYD
ncbi:hypothetical protein RUND412_001437 [Rhizina undulata]